MNKRIADLPASPAREVMAEARVKGEALLGGDQFNAESAILMGLCQMVLELRERVRAVEGVNRPR